MGEVLQVRLESKARDGYGLSYSTVSSPSHRDGAIMKVYKQRDKMIRFVFQMQNIDISVVSAIQ